MIAPALAIPVIAAGVPVRYVTSTNQDSDSNFAHALALALMRGQLLTDDDAANADSHRDETELARQAITREWLDRTDNLTIFEWNLRVSEERYSPTPYASGSTQCAWFSIHSNQGAGSAPCRYLSAGINHLESVMSGLGQTALAVLYEACHHYLPSVCTPRETLHIAEYQYWQGHENETDALEELMFIHGVIEPTGAEEFFTEYSIPRRAEFFRGAPEWIAKPAQVLSTADVGYASLIDDTAAAVVDACDEIHRIIVNGGPFARIDCRDAGRAPVDYSLYLLWDQQDGTDRILDDFIEDEMQADPLDVSCAVQLSLTGSEIGNWFARMRNTARLACAVEALLDLLALRTPENVTVQVRV
ncbi:PRTRC system protein F [Burkholderia cenocepacia]|uniref:PRTRC system protein F n=1 Tax=Burkholderia cenocepacia TaxID=95486 RepID=UPI001B98DD77|nr:PRTRC system protein F [Burkholderia cenocepacia]MBR7987987.1 PRTRC system protein F [Burkholderia cenocepacia]MBR8309504.1 PRTRC system protein F [Burkholderia cenocepacia]MCA7966343.1 PRTRC system protein F [Burkholderia cenocepacia]MDR8058070.1 PRTRC system protein F [Burkholderia cenocepacia]MDR8061840.1 PRTRC system protein F [Burkholderia cenocepacia]